MPATDLKSGKVFYGQASPNFTFSFGNHRRRVLRAKEERDLPACKQCSVQKPASLMVWGCINAYSMAVCIFWKALLKLKGIQYKGFRATYALLQTISISEKAFQER